MSKIEEKILDNIPVKEVYSDLAKPTVKSTGNLINIIPRTINAVLEPLHKWILTKEYNIEETKKLLEIKLSKVDPENIESPEPYVAVPAFKAISYAMDNTELRNMYANLLASSMNKMMKENVHPAYVEIIKQLSPDEAKILNYIYKVEVVPLITLRAKFKDDQGRIDYKKNISLIEEQIILERPNMIYTSLENLDRLKLIEIVKDARLVDKSRYNALHNSQVVKEIKKNHINNLEKWDEAEHFLEITELGKSFCSICVDKQW